jgi:hypothetical protein
MTKLDSGESMLAMSGDTVGPAVIAGTKDGYALAWRAGHVYFAEFDRGGNQLCAPLDLTLHFPEGSLELVPGDMAAGPQGAVLVGTVKLTPAQDGDPVSAIDGVHVAPGCRYVQRFRVADSVGDLAYPAIASAGQDGFAAVWSAEAAIVHRRILSPGICQ